MKSNDDANVNISFQESKKYFTYFLKKIFGY